MSIDKLKRVLWRLREEHRQGIYGLSKVRKAIMLEIGTDDRTIVLSIRKLIELQMLQRTSRWFFKDVGEEY